MVTASGPGLLLSAWLDSNANGTFDAGEQVVTNFPLATGPNSVPVLVPITTPFATPINWRFRASTQSGLLSTGLALDGEVEDYQTASVTPADLIEFSAE